MNLLDILRMGTRSRAPAAPPPEWTGPSRGEIGEAVGVQLELLRSGSAAVVIRGLVAYGSGLEFDLDVVGTGDLDLRDAMLFQLHQRGGRGGRLPRDLIRLAVVLADGTRATSLDFLSPSSRDGEARGPTLVCRRAGGSEGSWRFTWWLSPLPPPGNVTFECEWPSSGLPAARASFDASPLLEAAARSRRI